jgi:hypothetical protein
MPTSLPTRPLTWGECYAFSYCWTRNIWGQCRGHVKTTASYVTYSRMEEPGILPRLANPQRSDKSISRGSIPPQNQVQNPDVDRKLEEITKDIQALTLLTRARMARTDIRNHGLNYIPDSREYVPPASAPTTTPPRPVPPMNGAPPSRNPNSMSNTRPDLCLYCGATDGHWQAKCTHFLDDVAKGFCHFCGLTRKLWFGREGEGGNIVPGRRGMSFREIVHSTPFDAQFSGTTKRASSLTRR